MIELPETPPEIEIIHLDDNYVVVNKPAGFLVHPYKGRSRDPYTLMSVVRDQIGQKVFPIHRIDRPVSGVVLFCLKSELVSQLQLYWHRVDTVKEYITLCRGRLEEEGVFDFPLADKKKGKKGPPKPAKTVYTPLHVFEDATLCKVRIKTGRQHQIRRHFSRRMHNLIGDTNYGKSQTNHEWEEKYGLKRIFLHAMKLKIHNPVNEEEMEFFCPLADDLQNVLKEMGLDYSQLHV